MPRFRPHPSLLSALLVLSSLPAVCPAGVESRPHAARSESQGTRFQLLSPEITGVTATNLFDDPAMWAARYREFTLGAIGTGVGIGDLDTDGRPDLLVVTKTGGVRYYHNDGGWKFSDRTEAAGLALPIASWYQGVAIADVNGDGQSDFYVCRFNAPNQLFINQGGGRFNEEAAARGLALIDASSQATFADFDRDGHLDVYVQTNLLNAESRPNGQPDRLFRNRGDGTFVEVTASARLKGDTQGHSATWWDYDEDGWPDLYVANDFRDPDSLWRNRGDGTFSQELSRVVPSTPHSSMGADVGDLNNDGHLDIVVADMAATSRAADHRGMARVRAGLPDTDAQPQVAPQYMRNAVLLNTGAGRMEEVAWLTGLAATDWTWTVRLEDFDEDGWTDAYFTNGMVRELHNADLVKKMSAFESLGDRIRLMKASPELREQDLAFHNRGDLHFDDVSRAWGLDHVGVSFGAATGDLDGDGDLDLVVATMDGPFRVYRNDSRGHSLTLELRGAAGNRAGLGATVRLQSAQGRQTRSLLPQRGYLSSHQPLVHFGLGDQPPGELEVTWPSGRVSRLSGLRADTHLVISEEGAEAAAVENNARPWLEPVPESVGLQVQVRDRGVNELSRQPMLSLRQNRIGPSLTAADLDGDGAEDVLVGGASGDGTKFLSRLGDAFLPLSLTGIETTTDLADAALLAFDADGDGHTDLLVTKGGNAPETARASFQPRFYKNLGQGKFEWQSEAWPSGKQVVGAAAVADFDGDGDLDVFLGARSAPGTFPLPQPSALYRNDGGRFVNVTAELAPGLSKAGLVTSALWADFDRDGQPDLVVASEWAPIRLFLNRGGKLEEAGERLGFAVAGNGLWTSMHAADLNGDGVPDLVAGNLGLNTQHRASPKEPLLLWPEVAEPGGRAHLLETQWDGGKLYPLRGYSHLTAAFPSLARQFPLLDTFALATLDETIPAAWRAGPPLAATNLAHGVFLSQPDGTFRFAELPREAQVAPIYSWQAIDLNGDGHTDLIGLGNSFAGIPEVGRFSGGVGLVLQGDGRGDFAKVGPRLSGWQIPGDGKALGWLDLARDGQGVLVATRHHDRTQAWRVAGGTFGIRLQGRAGNPTAVGAWVEVVWPDGLRHGQTVTLGENHFTQSSPTLFFGQRPGLVPAKVIVRWPQRATVEYAWPTPPTSFLLLTQP